MPLNRPEFRLAHIASGRYDAILARPARPVEVKIFRLRCKSCGAEYTSKASNKKCQCGGRPERLN